jgi:regulator of cell morphogenesis and NO signaling
MSERPPRTPDEIADEMESRDHAFIRDLLKRIEERMAEAREGADEGAHHRLDALERILRPLAVELEHHMITEESALFPLVRKGRGGAERAAVMGHVIRHLETEHARTRKTLAAIRALSLDEVLPTNAKLHALRHALRELDDDLVEHMRVEGDILFPRCSGLPPREER